MRSPRLLLPLTMLSLLCLGAGLALLWSRPTAYGHPYSVTDLVARLQSNPGQWTDHPVAVRGRLVTIFNQNAPTNSNCLLIQNGPIHALQAGTGTPPLLLQLTRPKTWLSPVIGLVPSLAATLQPLPVWPPANDRRWQELHGRVEVSASCAGLPYLAVEALAPASGA